MREKEYCIGCTHYDHMHNKCRIGVDLPEECDDYETNDHYVDSDEIN